MKPTQSSPVSSLLGYTVKPNLPRPSRPPKPSRPSPIYTLSTTATPRIRSHGTPARSTTVSPQRVVPTFNYPSYPGSTTAVAPTRGSSSYDPFTFQTSSDEASPVTDVVSGGGTTTNVDVMVSGTTQASVEEEEEEATNLEAVLETTSNGDKIRVRSPKRKRKTQPFKRNMLMNIILRPGNDWLFISCR